MRPIWKGHISFGLVNVPVTLYPAQERDDVHFHMIDKRTFSRVRYKRVNAETGEEVPWDQIVKAYEYEEGKYVVMEKEELKQAAPKATKTVEIESFVDQDEIDPMYFEAPYYLEPGANGEKGYALLRDVLRESGKVGIARVVIRTRQSMAAMAPRDDALVLNLLRFEQELRPTKGLDLPPDLDEAGVTKQERTMARTLVDTMAGEWDPGQYHDEYRDALMAWINKKIKSGKVHAALAPEEIEEEAPAPINMMEALKKSLEGQSGAGRTSKKTRTAKKGQRKKAG